MAHTKIEITERERIILWMGLSLMVQEFCDVHEGITDAELESLGKNLGVPSIGQLGGVLI